MKRLTSITAAIAAITIFPVISHAQTLSQTQQKLQNILDTAQLDLSQDCQKLVAVATGIAGFGALFFIGFRVWKHLSAAEPIDFFPLFRPFVLTLCIGMFSSILDVFNGLLSPITIATNEIAENSANDVKVLIDRNDQAIRNGTETPPVTSPDQKDAWNKYVTPDIVDPKDSVTSGSSFSFGLNMINNTVSVLIKMFISKVLEVVYFAAKLCISTIRTFHLIILSILGPLVFAFSIYDGLQHTLAIWIGRYINIYLWLPICNLFSALINKIQANLLNIDYAQQMTSGSTMFTQTDLAYMVFLVIGIFGYFSIPSIANYVIHASGESALMRKVTSVFQGGLNSVSSGITSMATGGGSMVSDIQGPDTFQSPMADAANSEPYMKDSYQRKQLKG